MLKATVLIRNKYGLEHTVPAQVADRMVKDGTAEIMEDERNADHGHKKVFPVKK